MAIELTITVDASQAEAIAKRLRDNLGQAFQGIGRESAELRAKTQQTTAAMTDQFRGLGAAVQGVTAAFGALAVGAGLTSFVRSVVEANIAVQTITNTLKAVTGSTQAAGAEFSFLRDQSKRLGLDLQGTATQYAQLAAATKGTILAGQATRDVFVALSEAGTVLGLSQDRLGRAFTAVQQIISKGIVSQEELRQQLGEQLPGVLQAVAAQLGKTTAQLNAMIESGNLMASQFIPALTAALKNQFGPGVADAVNSAQAQFNRLQTAFFELREALGQTGLFDAVVAGAKGLTDVVNSLRALDTSVQRTLLGLTTFVAAFGTLATVAGVGAIAVGAFGAALGAATAPVLATVAGLAALAAGFVAWTASTTQQTAEVQKLTAAMTPAQRLFATLQGPTDALSKTFTDIAGKTNRTAEEQGFLAIALRELARRFPELDVAAASTGEVFERNVDKAKRFTAELTKQKSDVGLLASAFQSLKDTLDQIDRTPALGFLEKLGGTIRGLATEMGKLALINPFAPGGALEQIPTPKIPSTKPLEDYAKRIQELKEQGIGQEFPGTPADFSGVVNAGAVSLEQLKKIVTEFQKAESSFDPAKLGVKVQQLRTTLQALTEPIPGLTREQALKEFGFVDALGELLPDAERRARAAAQRINAELKKQQNLAVGITAETIAAENQLRQNAAEFRVRQAEQSLQKELKLIDVREAEQANAIQRERNTLAQGAQGNAAILQRIDEQANIKRLELAVQSAQERVAAQQQGLPAIQAARDAEFNAERASIQRLGAEQLDTAEQTRAKLAEVDQKQAASRGELNTKLLGLDQDLHQKQAALESARTQVFEREQAKRLELEQQGNTAMLQSQIQTFNAQKALIQEQVRVQSAVGDPFAAQAEGLKRLTAVQQEQFAVQDQLRQQAAQRAAQEAIATFTNGETLAKKLTQINALSLEERRRDEITFQTEQLRLQNQQLETYQHFVERVTDATSDMFVTIIDFFRSGFKNAQQLLDSLINYIIRQLADLAAYLLVKPLIIPVLTQVIGGIAGAVAPSLGNAILQSTGLAAGGGIDLLGTAGTVASIGGAANQLGLLGTTVQGLFGPINDAFAFIGSALVSGMNSMVAAINAVRFGTSIAVEEAVLASAQMDAALTGTVAPGFSSVSQVLPVLGGLAGLGGGIYSALSADTIPGQVGGALGAASGGFAAFAALAPALGIALNPIFAPIALALSALLPLLGNFIGGLGAPKGPRLAVGGFGGLGVSAGAGGLALTGDLTTQVLRAERLSGVNTGDIQSALEAQTTNLIQAMISTINAVAIDPNALLGPAQQALDDALNNALVLNSSNRKHMERDIQEQLKFIPLQIASHFLDPLLQAFTQLESSDLDERIQRLSPSVGALAAIFSEMSKRLDELAGVANDDVERNLSEVITRVNAFGDALVREANALSQGIVDAVIETSQQTINEVLQQSLEVQALSIPGLFQQRFEAAAALQGAASQLGAAGLDYSGIQAELERLFTTVITDAFALIDNAIQTGPFNQALAVILSIPPAVAALNPELQKIQASAAAFIQVASPTAAAIEGIKASLRPLSETITMIDDRISDLNEAIADAGDDIAVALPLYDELRQAILAQADAQTQLIQSIDAQLDQIDDLISGTASPAQQAADLEAQIAALAPAALAGTATPEQMQELIDLNQQLLALGEESDNLALQQEAIDNLTVLQSLLEQQLVAVTGTTDADAALQAVQEQALAELEALNDQLEALFLSQEAVQQSLQLPIPVVVTGQTAQHGGRIGYQGGGLIPVRLEPGEAVLPPMSETQLRVATAFNAAFPRFMGGLVPGVGSGDIVPAVVPDGSFVMNRRATGVLQGQGYQSGGPVVHVYPTWTVPTRPVGTTSPVRGYQEGGSVSREPAAPTRPVNVHINVNVHTGGGPANGRDIALEIRRQLERINMASFGPPKVR